VHEAVLPLNGFECRVFSQAMVHEVVQPLTEQALAVSILAGMSRVKGQAADHLAIERFKPLVVVTDRLVQLLDDGIELFSGKAVHWRYPYMSYPANLADGKILSDYTASQAVPKHINHFLCPPDS